MEQFGKLLVKRLLLGGSSLFPTSKENISKRGVQVRILPLFLLKIFHCYYESYSLKSLIGVQLGIVIIIIIIKPCSNNVGAS